MLSSDLIFKEAIKSVLNKIAIFIAGLMVGAFLGNVWFHVQMGNL